MLLLFLVVDVAHVANVLDLVREAWPRYRSLELLRLGLAGPLLRLGLLRKAALLVPGLDDRLVVLRRLLRLGLGIELGR